MERMTGPAGEPQRITTADRWDYTVAELRGIAAEHGLPTPSRLTHPELVDLLTTAGVPLPPKLPERMQPFRRRRGPLAG
jgi:hypothetical protein